MIQRSRKILWYGKQTLCALSQFQQTEAEVKSACSRQQFNSEYNYNHKNFFNSSSVRKYSVQEGGVGADSFDDFVDKSEQIDGQQDEEVSLIQSKLLSWLLAAVVRPDEKIAIKMLLTQFQVPLVIQYYRSQLMDSQLKVSIKTSEIGEVFPGTELRILSVRGEAEKVFIVMALIINNLLAKQKEHEVKSNLPFYIRVFFPEYLRHFIVGPGRSIQDEICQQTGCKIMSTNQDFAMLGTTDRIFKIYNEDPDGILQALIHMTGKICDQKGYSSFVDAPYFQHTEAWWMGVLYSQFPKYRLLNSAQYNVDIQIAANKRNRLLPKHGQELQQYCEYQFDEASGRITLQGDFISIMKAEAYLAKRYMELENAQHVRQTQIQNSQNLEGDDDTHLATEKNNIGNQADQIAGL